MKIHDHITSSQRPRLVPYISEKNGENRATSILFAALEQVPEFRNRLFASIGQKMGVRTKFSCATEVRFKSSKIEQNPDFRPDAIVNLSLGKNNWYGLVEVKTDSHTVSNAQALNYINLAKKHNIQAFITITNQFSTTPSHTPLELPKKGSRSIDIFHWSWKFILTQAVLTKNTQELADSERYILEQVVDYFSHKSSGVSNFNQMSPSWPEFNGLVQKNIPLKKSTVGLNEAVTGWLQEERDLSLQLSRIWHLPITTKLSRAEKTNLSLRKNAIEHNLLTKYHFETTLQSTGHLPDVSVQARLRSRNIICSVTIAAPEAKARFATRANWLISQLGNSDPNLHIIAHWPRRIADSDCSYSQLRDNVDNLSCNIQGESPAAFTILRTSDLAGVFSSRKKFIEALEKSVGEFYQQVASRIKPQITPPKKPALKQLTTSEDAATEIEQHTIEVDCSHGREKAA